MTPRAKAPDWFWLSGQKGRCRIPLKPTSALTSLSIALVLATGLGGTARAADPCPNAEFRIGPSANLPDCRAYELVSLPDSGGLPPLANNWANIESAWDMQLIDDGGESIMYQSVAGGLPGLTGNGLNDRYLATRTDEGWKTSVGGPTGAQTEQPTPGGISPDHRYSVFQLGAGVGINPDNGTLLDEFGGSSSVLRAPDGSFDLVAKGSLASATGIATTHWIGSEGQSIVFQNGAAGNTSTGALLPQLEPDAAPTGTRSLYMRSADGPTETLSMLPGEVQASSGQHSVYEGVGNHGDLIAFKLATSTSSPVDGASPLYVRVDSDHTDEVTPIPSTYAGAFGGHVFYADQYTVKEQLQTPADLYSYDTSTQSTTQITDVGDARFVNVSADGDVVYFLSDSEINGEGVAGQPNLYEWERSGDTTTFVATVTSADSTGDLHTGLGVGWGLQNLAAWTYGISQTTSIGGRASALSRSTADGSVLVFESTAQLTPYDNAGLRQVYRYEADAEEIFCLSCVGAGPAVGRASFQTFANSADRVHPLKGLHPVASLSDDGNQVVFEAEAELRPQDTNGHLDVYRWKEGEGLALITSGRAPDDSYVYAVTPDGSDIAFVTPQALVPEDLNGGVRALYDARVDGGFPAGDEGGDNAGCVGDACQGGPSVVPPVPGAASRGDSAGNPPGVDDGARCRKFRQQARKFAKRTKQLKRKARKLQRKARKANSDVRRRKARKKAGATRKKAKRQGRKVRNAKRGLRRCGGGSR